mgnify:FL=1
MNTLHKRDALLVIRDFYSKPGKCVWNNDINEIFKVHFYSKYGIYMKSKKSCSQTG